MAKKDPETEQARSEAREQLENARLAMAEMQQQLAQAKLEVATLFPESSYDFTNRKDMAQAKLEYQSTLKVHVISDCSDPKNEDLMRRMYGLYEKVFPLEEEREELDKLLKINTVKTSDAPSLEQWIVLEDRNGEIVGARNVMNLSAVKDAKVAKDIDGTQSLVYSFVDPRFRSLGLGDMTLQVAEEEGRRFVASTFGKDRDPATVDLIQVAEQNAPLNMSVESILVDTEGAKTDQFWRRHYYESMGFREVDFNYVQLPLEPREDGGAPCADLNLIARGAPGPKSDRGIERNLTQIPVEAAAFHMYHFSAYVAAGAYEIEADPDWIKQASALDEVRQGSGAVGVKPKLDFMALKEQTWNYMEKFINGKNFSKDAYEGTSIGELMGVDKIPVFQQKVEADQTAKPRPKGQSLG